MVRQPKPRDAGDADVILGQKIRSLRTERHLSQSDLGGHLGISFQQVQKYERGTNRVSAARLNRIAAFFKVDLAQFYVPQRSPFESLLLKDDPQVERMLRAYTRIKSVETQHQMVVLVEMIAARYG